MAAKIARAESSMEVEDSISRGSIEVCRLMHPDDANLAGNVHGGTILKLIEEGGFIIATRHCNRNRSKEEPVLAALARVERTDFIQPMFIGEVAQVHVQLGYASKRSLEVKASVWAENVLTGSRRLTNRASLWYVPIVMGSDVRIIPEVPALEYCSKEEEEEGKERYELQKRARLDKEEHFQENPPSNYLISPSVHPAGKNVSRYSVLNSESSLIHSVQPSECTKAGFVLGGVTMKMMDEVAGIVAFRHCKTNVVTASIDAIDFHAPVKLGHIIHITGRATFTSAKSMEIEVVVHAKDYHLDDSIRACSAYFTFVSLDEKRRPQTIPSLELHTEEEARRFEAGKKRYQIRKEKRVGQS
ncbi:cytosolic acyl coenzyme A thioester hydrolase-like [Stylophora pistillata]|uniref:Cytosolic acyl coenzyme A thioester hydrolase n=1 Tax=Stylophora pistillata TaxID=50429 RepID=A0A2B4RDM3_STYPI|nr:cytosolic acyl coenzyme A thioester hydrolase-like [Stylophora pistillata]PFX14919.1 Cytosolic acyl coenzyme A thioester hydrolase [Stylophora pistillata]